MITKLKTRCYYTDYVCHMIRFYLSTPEGLDMNKKQYSSSSIANWSSVQLVFHRMDADDAQLIRDVFGCGHYLPKAVDEYCGKTGADKDEVWKVLTRVNSKIARVRGLV